jgi:heat shock protein HslJ
MYRRGHFISVATIMMLLAACASTPTTPPFVASTAAATGRMAIPSQSSDVNPLAASRWRLISLEGQQLIEGTAITLAFDEWILAGSAGCNTYGGGPDSGPYLATLDGTLTITQTAITVKDCLEPQGIMEQETSYIKALQQAATYRITNGYLEIIDMTGVGRLLFTREP